MVVFSFYRGNLHKVPDTPRRWPMPKPSVSLENFRVLLAKRNEALSRLHAKNGGAREDEAEGMGDNGCAKNGEKSAVESKIIAENKRAREEFEEEKDADMDRELKCPKKSADDEQNVAAVAVDGMDCDPVSSKISADVCPVDVEKEGEEKPAENPKSGSDWCRPEGSENAKLQSCNAVDPQVAEEMDVDSHKQESASVPEEKPAEGIRPAQEAAKSTDATADKVKRKAELESKLKVLTEEKHRLVQMLKHILSSEEEMKKRSQMAGQPLAMNAPHPYQEATVDVGSVTRQAGRRVGTELNFYGDLEEGELEDACTRSPNSQNLHHVHGPPVSLGSVLGRYPNSLQQPSQTSQQMKTGLAAIGHSQINTNASSGAMSSPSPFGAQGTHPQHAHMPPMSISGVQAAASSPSPATSSGTSIFCDARLTSPSWNQR